MIRSNVVAIRVAVITCSIATLFRRCRRVGKPGRPAPAAPAQPAPGRGGRGQEAPDPSGAADSANAGADRPDRLVGVGRHGRLALADGDAAEGRLRERADQRRKRRTVADTWDPAKDEREGNACRAYGVAGIMRVPGRLHITWQDENTLKIETDAGTQTRLLHFAPLRRFRSRPASERSSSRRTKLAGLLGRHVGHTQSPHSRESSFGRHGSSGRRRR